MQQLKAQCIFKYCHSPHISDWMPGKKANCNSNYELGNKSRINIQFFEKIAAFYCHLIGFIMKQHYVPTYEIITAPFP